MLKQCKLHPPNNQISCPTSKALRPPSFRKPSCKANEFVHPTPPPSPPTWMKLKSFKRVSLIYGMELGSFIGCLYYHKLNEFGLNDEFFFCYLCRVPFFFEIYVEFLI